MSVTTSPGVLRGDREKGAWSNPLCLKIARCPSPATHTGGGIIVTTHEFSQVRIVLRAASR